MFFMGNTSLCTISLVVRDMVSSNSLGSLLSTLLYILGFHLWSLKGVGMVSIWFSIHGTLGMDSGQDELAFSAFHCYISFL